ncbi:hypothetical protein ACWFRJ_11015 [Streptomyces sp. NPDC055239]
MEASDLFRAWTGMQKKTLIISAACVVGLWAVGSAVTPTLKEHSDDFPDVFNDHVLHERVKTFPTEHEARESADGELIFRLPKWVPRDATDITIKAQTTGNAKLMRFTLADTPLKLTGEEGCLEGAFSDGPTLVASWWPQDVGADDGRPDCSGQYQLRVAVKGDKVYAWSNGDMVKS